MSARQPLNSPNCTISSAACGGVWLALKARYGDSPAMRRIVIDADRILSDVELLDTDVSELDLARATVQQSGEKIAIPDTEYDRDFWRDVDDEGVGGHSRY